jgi:heme-degrading monooxygenase HmoA
MEKVLIDKFIVPGESKAEFLEAARKSAQFLRTLPGFIEGYVYEKLDGESRYNIMTTAVWESEDAFTSARKAAMTEFQKIGFNPQEIMKKLKVEMERAVYDRSPY